MQLAIDGYEANAQGRVGVGRFASELIAHLYRVIGSGASAFTHVTVYLPEHRSVHMPKNCPYWENVMLRPKPLWTFVALPWAICTRRPRLNVVFSPTHYVPRFVSVPRVMAIMDVSYLIYPELFRSEDLHKLVHWTAYAVRHSSAIITISQFSKDAIIKAYNVPKDRVTVAYPALPEGLAGDKRMGSISYHLPKRYILSVGTIQPRKNYGFLIEAFSKLADSDLELLIVGKKGWLYEDILAAPSKFGVADRVKFLDFVSDKELPALYRGAVCFALPSLYEGFGLPVLEAMAHGTSVVVSNTSSLPEIAGEAGIYVNPLDVQSIVKGLTQAVREHGTEVEKKRVVLGKKRAGQFSWDTSAKKVLKVLEEVGKK